jgi:hypothetical protein
MEGERRERKSVQVGRLVPGLQGVHVGDVDPLKLLLEDFLREILQIGMMIHAPHPYPTGRTMAAHPIASPRSVHIVP